MTRTVVHELKTWPEPFQAVVDGRKTFEIRQDDRGGFRPGDELKLEEYVPPYGDGVGRYTGRYVRCRVGYVAKGWGLPDGLVVMALTGVETIGARPRQGVAPDGGSDG